MTLPRLHLRPRRPSAAPAPDPNACHCVIPHPLTAAERERVDLAQVRARCLGDTVLAGRLVLRLSTPCRTAGAVCHCGCGRPPGQHNPQTTSELRSAA